jgi:hypothetical protein
VEHLATKMGIDYRGSIDKTKSDNEVYLPEITDDYRREVGANLVLNSTMQYTVLDKPGLSANENLQNVAIAKKLALAGNETDLEAFVNQNGNNQANLTGQELRALFEPSEHLYNHMTLNSTSMPTDGSDAFRNRGSWSMAASHYSSLNSNPLDGTAANTIGGYNDKGEYMQTPTVDTMIAVMEKAQGYYGIS